MRTLLLAALLLSATPLAVLAEEPGHSDADDVPLYEGAWNVHFEGQRTARFVLNDWQGTWTETGPARSVTAACRGKEDPVTNQHSTTTHLEFTVWGSQVSRDCPDIGYLLEPAGAGALQGQSGTKDKVRMTRARRG